MHLPPVLRNLSKSSLLILAVSLLSVANAQGGPPGGGGGPPGGGISSGGPPGGGGGGPPGGGSGGGGGPPGGGAGGPPGGGAGGPPGGGAGGPPPAAGGPPPAAGGPPPAAGGPPPAAGGPPPAAGGPPPSSGGPIGGGAGVVGGGIRSHSCPKPHTFDLNANPVVVTFPTCPQDDGNLFATPDGAHWTFQCCAHGKGTKVGPDSVEPDFEHCAAKCASTPGCKSITFSARAQSPGHALGNCQLYDAAEPSAIECGDDTHNYAFISPAPPIDSPEFLTIACSTECPFANGQQYTASKGEVFHMDCEKRHGTKVLHFDDQDTFKDCMDACSALTACHSVDYHTNSKTCYYGSHHGEPTIDALGFQSAHSLGCSGACSEKTCGSTSSTSSTA